MQEPQHAASQHTVITPPGRLNMPQWREIWRSREVAFRLAQRDIIVRYRQTIFGITWVMLQPLVTAGVFTIVFGVIAGLESDGIPTFVFTMAAMLAWGMFNGAVTQASSSMVSNQPLVQKVFFPRILVPISSLVSIVVDFLVGFGLLVVLLIIFGITPSWALLLLPVWVLLILMLGLGLGLMAAAYLVKYRDVGYVLPWALQILMYASPLAYSINAVPEGLRWFFEANPITWFLEVFRWATLGADAPEAWQIIALAVGAPVILLLGTLVFQKNEREFADFI